MNVRTYPRRGMHASDQLSAFTITVIVFKQEFAGFFVKSRFGVRINQKTLDGHENVSNPVGRLPILLEGVHTNFA